jgi:hypothetical protein
MNRNRAIPLVALLLAAFICSGCATSKTVGVAKNAGISGHHWNSVTHCRSVPRVYSGLAYNSCFALFADRKHGAMYNSFEVSGYLLDSVASTVADTLALPYTAYTQYQSGSIKVADHDLNP